MAGKSPGSEFIAQSLDQWHVLVYSCVRILCHVNKIKSDLHFGQIEFSVDLENIGENTQCKI